MMKFNPQYPCSNCQKYFTGKELRKKAFSGSLKPYQFTPAPSLHCPYCGQKLRADYPKKYLYMMFLGLMLIILLMIIKNIFPDFINKTSGDFISLAIFVVCGAWAGLKLANSTIYYKSDD